MFQYQRIPIKAKRVNGNVLFFKETRRRADKAVCVADMDDRVSRAVTAANHEANQEACKQSILKKYVGKGEAETWPFEF